MSKRRAAETRKYGARRWENNKIYACPLPIVFSPPPSTSVLGFLHVAPRIVLNPCAEGVFDPVTPSVWITGARDARMLWERGFFGKGDLSRSEPSWVSRQVNARKAAALGKLTAEEVTARRRAQRRQFKLDRAMAVAAAAAEAESAFAEGREVTTSAVVIPSGATWRPNGTSAEESDEPAAMMTMMMTTTEAMAEDDGAEDEIPDVERLQLTLQEAFFLIWTLDCLSVLDPNTNEPMSLLQIWLAFQSCHTSRTVPSLPFTGTLRPDAPFLVNYVVYHHFRALGWVVKSGIKFCVDYLLYKRGPVFNHAEFALVVCPVYEDPADQESAPFDLQNARPFSWSWLSTINRVNSQVMKTLILVYVTIPPQSSVSTDVLCSPSCLLHYSVREVTVRRFIPARMRD